MHLDLGLASLFPTLQKDPRALTLAASQHALVDPEVKSVRDGRRVSDRQRLGKVGEIPSVCSEGTKGSVSRRSQEQHIGLPTCGLGRTLLSEQLDDRSLE
jgi:hypothetical protein